MIKGLYVHIPFCSNICIYCDFCKMVAKEQLQHQYLNALISELQHYKQDLLSIETIYIGGGTPSSLSVENLTYLLQELTKWMPVSSLKEFTIEANPNDINQMFIDILKQYGVNRISIGVQTIHNNHLKFLKRTHQEEDVIQCISLLRKNNFFNINLDFIYSIPNQTIEDLKSDLAFIERMDVPHISYYSLIIEEKTELHYLLEKQLIQLVHEDVESDFQDLIHQQLKQFGYHRYEISNFAKNNQISHHNMLYWNVEEYLGIGLGASSQYQQTRYKNPTYITRYISNIENNNFSRLKEDCNLEVEYLLLGLRKTKGIDVFDFAQRFGKDIFASYSGLTKHLENGLLIFQDNWLFFSSKGLDLSNQVYMDII